MDVCLCVGGLSGVKENNSFLYSSGKEEFFVFRVFSSFFRKKKNELFVRSPSLLPDASSHAPPSVGRSRIEESGMEEGRRELLQQLLLLLLQLPFPFRC